MFYAAMKVKSHHELRHISGVSTVIAYGKVYLRQAYALHPTKLDVTEHLKTLDLYSFIVDTREKNPEPCADEAVLEKFPGSIRGKVVVVTTY
jgi:hypothetical protein